MKTVRNRFESKPPLRSWTRYRETYYLKIMGPSPRDKREFAMKNLTLSFLKDETAAAAI